MKDVRVSYAAARVNRNLTQKEAAKLIGINVFTLINYENSKTVPSWKTHNKMAEVYEIPPEMLSAK